MSADAIRDAIGAYLQPLVPVTLAYTRSPKDPSDLVRAPLVNEVEDLTHGPKSDRVIDAFAIEAGDERGRKALTTHKFGGGNPYTEQGLYIRDYTFTLWLYKDARLFTRDDIINQLEVYVVALLEEQTLGGLTQVRSQDPDIVYTSMAPEEYSDYMFYTGCLTVAYQDLWATEER